tara:strand:+ start:2787 stop:3140 length:354 start_codon:yes stop_codon:yes gene_type:complete
MNNLDKLEFICYFIIGGFIIAIMNYFSKYNKTKYLALLPALPIVGIYGLLLILKNKKNYNEYLINISSFVFTCLLFYILIFIINKIIMNIYLSLIISLFIWFCLVYKLCIDKNYFNI